MSQPETIFIPVKRRHLESLDAKADMSAALLSDPVRLNYFLTLLICVLNFTYWPSLNCVTVFHSLPLGVEPVLEENASPAL